MKLGIRKESLKKAVEIVGQLCVIRGLLTALAKTGPRRLIHYTRISFKAEIGGAKKYRKACQLPEPR